MTRKEAEKIAQKISQEEGVVQHVNCRIKSLRDGDLAEMDYYVYDWYNCDSTVTTFINGERQ